MLQFRTPVISKVVDEKVSFYREKFKSKLQSLTHKLDKYKINFAMFQRKCTISFFLLFLMGVCSFFIYYYYTNACVRADYFSCSLIKVQSSSFKQAWDVTVRDTNTGRIHSFTSPTLVTSPVSRCSILLLRKEIVVTQVGHITCESYDTHLILLSALLISICIFVVFLSPLNSWESSAYVDSIEDYYSDEISVV